MLPDLLDAWQRKTQLKRAYGRSSSTRDVQSISSVDSGCMERPDIEHDQSKLDVAYILNQHKRCDYRTNILYVVSIGICCDTRAKPITSDLPAMSYMNIDNPLLLTYGRSLISPSLKSSNAFPSSRALVNCEIRSCM